MLLLSTGVALGFARSLGRQWHILRRVAREWKQIDRDYLFRVLREFKHDRLISYREHTDGSVTIILTEEGKRRAIRYNIDTIAIKKPPHWDGVWRVVFSDIPEEKRRARDALRRKLRELGFYRWQKSVFIYPYPCRDEIDFLVEFFEMRSFVCCGELINPTNEAELKLHFHLS